MINDKEIENAVSDLKTKIDIWQTTVVTFGNQCSYTDRLLEEILESAKKLKNVYSTNFIEGE